MIRPIYLRSCLLVILLGLSLPSVLNSQNGKTESNVQWGGWRGLHLQGHSPSQGSPVHWSDSSNVLWSTKIKGEGHSSPVVSNSCVFVTSVWHTDDQPVINKILTYFIFLGLLFLLLSIVPFLIKTCNVDKTQTNREFVSILIFWMLLGLSIYSLHFSHWLPEGFLATNSGVQFTMWFHSGIIVALCLVLASFFTPPNSRKRFVIAIFLILWGAFLLLERPYPNYYNIFNTDILTLTRMTIPLIFITCVGVILLLRNIFARPKNTIEIVEDVEQVKGLSLFRMALVGSTFLLGLTGFATFIIFNLSKMIYFLLSSGRYSFPQNLTTITDRIGFLLEPSFSYPWFLIITNVGFFIWILSESISHQQTRVQIPFAFSWGIIVLGLLNFTATNYLQAEVNLKRGITCLYRESGKVKWQMGSLVGPPAEQTRTNSLATPTPLIDGERVYAYFGSPGLICTDYDGNLLWTNTELPFEGIHGIGASPVISGEHLIVLSAMSKAPYLTALNRNTGERIWTVKLKTWNGLHGEHRTPLITSYDGRDIIIDWGSELRPILNIYDALTGKSICKYPTRWNYKGVYITTVLMNEDLLYLSDKGGVRALSLMKLIQGGEPLMWETNLHSKGPQTATPVISSGMLFMISDKGWATCLDAETGEFLWRERLEYGYYYSSPIVAGGNVYFSNIQGITTVVKCNRSFKRLKVNVLQEGLYASPAIAYGQIIMRTSEHVWCLSDKEN